MIEHDDIVTAQEHEGKNASQMDEKGKGRSCHICGFRGKCENAEDNGKRQQRMFRVYAKVSLPENKKTEQDDNAYDTVVILKNCTVRHDKDHTEGYGDKNLEQVDKQMAQLILPALRFFDKLL